MRTIVTLIALLVCVVSIAPAVPVHAQQGTPLLSSSLELTLSPSTPVPGQSVFARITTFSVDLERAYIQWYENGQLVDEGNALDVHQFFAGAAGTETEVVAVVQTIDGVQISARATVRPAFVTIAWEANTWTPPLYRGRALPSAGASVSAVAITDFTTAAGGRIPASDIVYTWRIDNRVISGQSGRGRSTATFSGPRLYGAQTVSVEATSIDYRYRGAASTQVRAIEPLITLYPERPLLGVTYYDALADTANTPDAELSIIAAPYFFGRTGAGTNLTYQWRIDGEALPNDAVRDPSRITIATNEAQEGFIELSIRHRSAALQTATGAWLLRFGVSDTGTPFNVFR